MPSERNIAFQNIAAAVLIAALALVIRWALAPLLGERLPYVTFFIAVAGTVYVAGTRAALVATVIGALLALLYIIPPDDSIALTSVVDITGMAMYFSVSLAIVAFGSAARRGQDRALRAENQARAQMELLRQTLVSIGDAVITTDAAGNVTLLNRVAEQLTGWSNADARGLPLTQVFHIVNEDTREPVDNPVQGVLESGEIVGLANHTVLIDRSSSEHMISDSAAPISDSNGKIIGVVLVFRDITAARAAEKALIESEGRKSGMLKSALDGVICIDHESNIIEFNPAAELMFGYNSSDVIGQDMAELIVPPDLRERHRAGLGRYLESGQEKVLNRLVELTAVHADGRQFPVEISICPVDHVGRSAFVGYIRDISDRKRDETALRESEERFRALTMATAAIVWRTNAAGEFDIEQPSWSAYTGQSWDQYQGEGWIAAIHPDDKVPLSRIWAEAVSTRQTYRWSARLWHAKSKSFRYFETFGVPITDDDGELREWIGLCRDVEREKHLETQLQKTVSDLTEADRRKNEFLATLAHELRNPLAPVCNALEIVNRPDVDRPTIRDSYAIMKRQLGQMTRLVDDLFDMSRIDRGLIDLQKERLDLATVIAHALEAARPLSDTKGQDLKVNLPAEPVAVYADSNRLVQVIGNLLSNAIKYSGPGGSIRLNVELEQGDAVIKVEDDGIGIESDQLSRIFDLFVQLDTSLERAQSGLGIGLTLVKRIVELHDGQVSAHSRGAGGGSEFRVRLPLLSNEPVDTNEDPAAMEQVRVPAHRILIVDDNRDSADSLALLLRMSGHQTFTAYDGSEALQSAQRLRPNIIVLDIGLPGKNGYDVAKDIRASEWGADTVLVALTGWGQDADKKLANEAGFNAHFVKPMNTAAMMDFLKTVSRE